MLSRMFILSLRCLPFPDFICHFHQLEKQPAQRNFIGFARQAAPDRVVLLKL